ncbi:shikimate dehydrogenase family protein [Microbacterium sp. PMB16]|uniref:shikimate dehydrogenase family protein n=1 Tax=Microbacterium sp. PMB16 TaxID=3120157 RepID=UPI003F4B0F4B
MSSHLNGASRLYPIVGDPVAFVQSPVWLTRTLGERGHNGVCVPLEVAADDLEVVMAGLTAAKNVDGLLITMPHKFAAFDYCATSSPRASLFGVVSVIRRNPDSTWHGDMLDGLAFVKAQQDHGAKVEGARALLIGAGGAGSAIAHALLDAGVAELVVHDTDRPRLEELIDRLRDVSGGRISAGPGDPTGFDLVFNATPLGLQKGDPSPVDTSLLASSMFVGDVIAGHGVTPLIAAAQTLGCPTANGEDMVEAVQDLMADFLLDA